MQPMTSSRLAHRILLPSLTLLILLLTGCTEDPIEPTNPNDPNPPANGVFTPGTGATDIDGNTYPTIILGNQEWFAENLRTTRYQNGDNIPAVTIDSLWNTLSTGAYASFNNDPSKDISYGKVYNGFTADQANNPCPQGWHVPTNTEWQFLVDYLGGNTQAGGKLKATGTSYWLTPNTGATNLSGFNAKGTGNRNLAGAFAFEGEIADYWTSARYITGSSAWYVRLANTSESITFSNGVRRLGFCIRCLKN